MCFVLITFATHSLTGIPRMIRMRPSGDAALYVADWHHMPVAYFKRLLGILTRMGTHAFSTPSTLHSLQPEWLGNVFGHCLRWLLWKEEKPQRISYGHRNGAVCMIIVVVDGV